MNPPMNFRFQIPNPPAGKLIEVSMGEAEMILLRSLHFAEGNMDTNRALWNLAQFYKVNGQHDEALRRLRELIGLLNDPEAKAECVFTMGQAMEQKGDYLGAVRYYKEATALEPAGTFTWYYIQNNLGFSLNMLGRFEEGAMYSRRAIGIDPHRPNGHKNLGVALAALGHYRAAARSFITATRVNAADGRSATLLEDLLQAHPELEFEFAEEAKQCREAVDFASEKIRSAQPQTLRGWRKQLVLFRLNMRWLFGMFRRGK